MKDIASIIELLNRSHAKFLDVCEQFPSNRWKKNPASGGWSAGEVVAHLTMVEETVLRFAREELSKKPRRHSLFQKFHLPVGLVRRRLVKRTTPIPLDSSLVEARKEALEKFSSARNHTLKFIAEHSSRDLTPYRRKHPFLGSLHLYDWMRMLAYHEIRHVSQIREIGKSFEK